MKIAIDVNRYADFCREDPTAVDIVRRAERIWMPFVVLAELRAGFQRGSRPAENERILSEFLRPSRVNVLYPDEATTHFYANLFVDLRKRGTPIPSNDLWIAALTIQHGLTLFTRDGHFARVPMVPRV